MGGFQDAAADLEDRLEAAQVEIERLTKENTDLRRWRALEKPITAAMAIVSNDMQELRAQAERLNGVMDTMTDLLHSKTLECEQLRTDLAEVDAMLATHAFTIDSSPPERWPKDSILKKAVDRHIERVLAGKP